METDTVVSALQTAGLYTCAGPAPLTDMLFQLMADAEARFGARDASWFFGGINY